MPTNTTAGGTLIIRMFRAISKGPGAGVGGPGWGGLGVGSGPEQQEVGEHAVWTLSSAKPGFGVEQLRDDNIDTYWQYAPFILYLLELCNLLVQV